MSLDRFKRTSLRSPLKAFILFENEGYVFKAQTLNISEGGVLLSDLPIVPEINAIPLMLSIPKFPELSSLSHDVIKNLKIDDLDKDIFRMKARLVRTFEGKSAVDKIFVTQIGCEFVKPSETNIKLISNYVSTFAKNIIYLLNLFESMNKNPKNIELIRVVADLLGYDSNEKIAMLRLKVLHDYQSLESL
jgi:hypothetical protein